MSVDEQVWFSLLATTGGEPIPILPLPTPRAASGFTGGIENIIRSASEFLHIPREHTRLYLGDEDITGRTVDVVVEKTKLSARGDHDAAVADHVVLTAAYYAENDPRNYWLDAIRGISAMEADAGEMDPLAAAYDDCDDGDGSYDYRYQEWEGEFDGVDEGVAGMLWVELDRTIKRWRLGEGRRFTPRRWVESKFWPDDGETAATTAPDGRLIRDDDAISGLPLIKKIAAAATSDNIEEEVRGLTEVDEDSESAASMLDEEVESEPDALAFSIGMRNKLPTQFRNKALKEFLENKSSRDRTFGEDPRNALEAMRVDASTPGRISKAPVLAEEKWIAAQCAKERKIFFRSHVLPALIGRSEQDYGAESTHFLLGA
eukprot:g18362.t1